MERLVEIAPGVWGADTTVSIGLGAHLPLRMTVLRQGQGLALVSPIAIDDALARDLSALGPVTALIGPNALHHRYLSAARSRYPDATLWLSPGLVKKRPDLGPSRVLASGALSSDIKALLIEGAEKLSEVVFLHRPSASLVVTDAVFHVTHATGMSRFVLKYVSGAYGSLAQSRLLRSLTDDRAATARSVNAMLAFPIERLVMAHGEVVEERAAERLQRALWWWRNLPSPVADSAQAPASP